MSASYDFVVVGAGPAGCALASRLARGTSHSVLLLEAGGTNDDISRQIHADRWTTFATVPEYNWQLKSTPQAHLGGKVLNVDSGRGLGGGTSINFSVYTYGASADYDRWADEVGDDAWRWENVQKRFAKLETYSPPPSDFEGFAKPISAHGQDGPVKVSFADKYEKGFKEFLVAARQSDYPKSMDYNSGDPLGVALIATTSYKGRRTTASTSYLSDKPANLTIKTDTQVAGVIFEGTRAVGVKTDTGNIFANKEVVLSAGATQTPKILLLSGVGPSDELSAHGIPGVLDLPGIGKELFDHAFTFLAVEQKDGTNDRGSFFSKPELVEAARKEWLETQGGLLNEYYSSEVIAYLKLDKVLQSEEFAHLPEKEQGFLVKDTVPMFELISHLPPIGLDILPTATYHSLCVAFMNPQSRGSITLESSDPKDPPRIDNPLLRDKFDQRVAIETIREAMSFMESPAIKKDTVRDISAPKDDSDEEIWAYIQKTVLSMWHHGGSVKMGKPGAQGTCVDTDFRVVGAQGLRVIDMSVAPYLPNAHTSAVAYLIGETGAEKLLSQYA